MFDFDPSDCPPWYDTSISRLYEHMRHHPEPWRDGEQLLAIRRALDVDKAQLFLDRCGGRRRGARSRHQRCALPGPAFASRRHAASEPPGTHYVCCRARLHCLLTRSAVPAPCPWTTRPGLSRGRRASRGSACSLRCPRCTTQTQTSGRQPTSPCQTCRSCACAARPRWGRAWKSSSWGSCSLSSQAWTRTQQRERERRRRQRQRRVAARAHSSQPHRRPTARRREAAPAARARSLAG